MKKKLPVKKKMAKKAMVKKATPKKVVKKSIASPLANRFETLQEYEEPGKFLIIHGMPGEGKTTIAAHAPNPLFVISSDEQGIKQAITANVVPPELRQWIVELDPVLPMGEIQPNEGHAGWIKAVNTARVFLEGNHDRQTLVYDSTSGLQTLCHQHTASMMFNGDMVCRTEGGFMNYYQGYHKAAEQYWQRELLATLSNIVAKGMNVILIAHTSLSSEPNPDGPETKMYVPDLDKRIWNWTKKAVQGTLFLGRSRIFRQEESTKKLKVSSEARFCGVNNTTWYEAKNWFNIQHPLDVGESAAETWDNIASALNIV